MSIVAPLPRIVRPSVFAALRLMTYWAAG